MNILQKKLYELYEPSSLLFEFKKLFWNQVYLSWDNFYMGPRAV